MTIVEGGKILLTAGGKKLIVWNTMNLTMTYQYTLE